MNETPPQRSGCLVALYALFGLGVLAVGVIAVAAFFFVRSEPGQQALRAVREGVDAATQATMAPGADALREEAGCDRAVLVTTPGDLVTFFGQFDLGDAAPPAATGPAAAERLVVCDAATLGPSLSCDSVAGVYVAAVESLSERFIVGLRTGVGGALASDFECLEYYSPEGARLGAADRETFELIQPVPAGAE
ncbi:MAG: hypothetical protein MJE66_10210 [Proteobacteria bacterium]|nr:hypothetical protein [Pseudomonadota bacterium]